MALELTPERQLGLALSNETSDVFNTPPSVLVRRAVFKLVEQGIRLTVWGALLDCSMGLPRVVIDYSFIVPDDQLDAASQLLSDMGLPRTPPHQLLIRTEGDFVRKGHFHRVTTSTALGSLQCIWLVPASFPGYDAAELECYTFEGTQVSVYAPRPSAVFAGIIRMIKLYPKQSPERYRLHSDLELLTTHHLLRLERGYVDDELWEELDMDRRMDDAEATIRSWGKAGQWREGEKWMEDALVGILQGNMQMEQLVESRN